MVLFLKEGKKLLQGDTISAIATPAGEGGIGIIRISGEKALEVADRMFRPYGKTGVLESESHRALYGHVADEKGRILDEVICIPMKSPHSYTMEDVVELQSHGGSMVLREILSLSWRLGARPAERGEFTKRAFLNGRLDLSQAQAVMDVIKAPTEESLYMAAGQLAGKFSNEIEDMRNEVLGIIAHLEAAIDFPEDDIDDVELSDAEEKVKELRTRIKAILATARTGKILRDGLMTAILGKPNVGKSSLLNAILREKRAIVTDIPGTTRDSIEELADVGGIPLRIIDTAGIRSTEDKVEKIGVEKSRAYADEASLILAVFDSSRPLGEEDMEILSLIKDKESIILLNKTDLEPVIGEEDLKKYASGAEVIRISVREDAADIDELTEAIRKRVYSGIDKDKSPGFVSSELQAEILRQGEKHLEAAEETITMGMSPDFVVIDLRSAWEKLGELTGGTVGEDIIDEIFSRFCIGK